jgi:hypothetical protein
MRTTVEITDEHRAKLLELAARRGEKGFSSVLEEAISHYLQNIAEEDKRLRKAQALRGSLSRAQADHLRRTIAEIRKKWRSS